MSSESQSKNQALETLTIQADDGSIRGNFIRVGACITDLFVKNRDGEELDVVTGYDDRSRYLAEPPVYFGAVIGRYGNRIKNCQFKLPSSGEVVKVSQNHGKHSLHGGFLGYDRQTWTLVDQSKSSLTFEHDDPEGHEGYPGSVKASVTYKLENHGKWSISMKATSTKETPIGLTQHNFFNLDGYRSETMDHYQLAMLADRIVEVDGESIPTGELPKVAGTPFDFQKSAELGPRLKETGGIDHCLVYAKDASHKGKIAISSPKSGIRMEVHSDQIAVQVYTAIGFDGSIPRKESQGGSSKFYTKQSAIALEQQSYIDGVNNQEKWGVNQFLKPGEEYTWNATYEFGLTQ